MATAILDLRVRDNLYDVFFRWAPWPLIYGVTPEFEFSDTDVFFALDAVDDALNDEDITGVSDPNGVGAFPLYQIGVAEAPELDGILWFGGFYSPTALAWLGEFNGVFVAGSQQDPPAMWADFRQQVIPIPAAVWLFGSALGLLGWMRRKTT